MIDKINFQELQNIYVLSKCLNMQSAANALKMPKSTLQKHLEAVEKKLGTKIFDRSQKSGEMSFTQFGKSIIPKIQNILWLAGSLSMMDKFSKDSPNSGEISIMSTQTILENYICPYIRELLIKNPNLTLSLKQKDENYYSQPKLNEVFIGCWENNTETYEYIPFHSYEQKLWASSTYLESNPPIKTLNDLKGHTLICLMSINENEHITTQDSLFRKLGPLRKAIKVLNVAGPRTTDVLAKNGAGILVTATETVKLCALDLLPVLPEISGEIVQIYVKIHKQLLQWPLGKFIVDWIFECRDRSFRSIDTPTEKHSPLLENL
jgi:DNA-binding transcriptional LysR family regulator